MNLLIGGAGERLKKSVSQVHDHKVITAGYWLKGVSYHLTDKNTQKVVNRLNVLAVCRIQDSQLSLFLYDGRGPLRFSLLLS